MNNPTHHTCPTCGYTWLHGQHGGHSCALQLKPQIDSLAMLVRMLVSRLNKYTPESSMIARAKSHLARLGLSGSALRSDEQLPDIAEPSAHLALIAAERARQINAKGYSAERDDAYRYGELAHAAASYADLAGKPGTLTTQWPWAPNTFKPSHDRMHDLAKAGALIVAEMERLGRAGTAVLSVKVERDKYGHWTHPVWPKSDDDDAIPKAWFIDRGLQLFTVDFEDDAPEELVNNYFESGEPDVSSWEPTKPEGSGWFVFSIHDTDNGPICAWVRPQSAARSDEHLEQLRLKRDEPEVKA
ncbi:MAG: hypothetical protein ACKVIS_11090 [Pseudomonadales bacterium]